MSFRQLACRQEGLLALNSSETGIVSYKFQGVATSLDSLGDDVLCSILPWLSLEDLLRFSRVSRRFHGLVNSACGDAAWQRLFQETFGGSAHSAVGAAPLQQQAERQHQQQQAEQEQQAKRSRLAAPTSSSPSQRQHEPGAVLGPTAAITALRPGAVGSSVGQARHMGLAPLPQPASPRPCIVPWEGGHIAAGSSQGGEGGSAAAGRPRLAAGTAAAEPGGCTAGPSWKEQFRERYTEEQRRLRLKRRARVMKQESSVQLLGQEVHRLQRALGEEQGRLEVARQDLAAIQAERRAQAVRAISSQYWLPEAVQRAQGVVTSQTAVDLEGREETVRQQVAVCELEVRKLRAQARQRGARLEEERRKLQALQP